MRRPHRPTRSTVTVTGIVLATALAALAAVPAHGRAPEPLPGIGPRAETATLYDDEAGGGADADDPAIWRNAADPGRSLVIATAKEGGLRVYDLDARQVQAIPADGAAVLNAPLGAKYPHGLLVVQDGRATPTDGDREGTGFKFVDLAEVLDRIDD